jgi:hypothetical protein
MPKDISILDTMIYQKDTSIGTCKTVKFKVVDVSGRPIYSFHITLYKQPSKTRRSNDWFLRNSAYTGNQVFDTDEDGALEVNYSSFDSVQFTSLAPYQDFLPKYPLSVMEGKSVFLRLNANGIAFTYPTIELSQRNVPMLLKLKNNTLTIDDGRQTLILTEE